MSSLFTWVLSTLSLLAVLMANRLSANAQFKTLISLTGDTLKHPLLC
jgi:hypothetical protein